jgi:hypothetical protein
VFGATLYSPVDPPDSPASPDPPADAPAAHPDGSTALIYNQVFKVVANLISPPISGILHFTSIHAPFFLLAAVFST